MIRKYSDGNGNIGRTACVGGIVFFAYPHQPFYAINNNHTVSAICNNIWCKGMATETGGYELDEKWSATIHRCNPDGTSEFIEQKHFDNSDNMFGYACGKLKGDSYVGSNHKG